MNQSPERHYALGSRGQQLYVIATKPAINEQELTRLPVPTIMRARRGQEVDLPMPIFMQHFNDIAELGVLSGMFENDRYQFVDYVHKVARSLGGGVVAQEVYPMLEKDSDMSVFENPNVQQHLQQDAIRIT